MRNINRPIGIAEYQTEIIKKFPKDLKNSLPTIAELEAELEKTDFIEKNSKKIKKPKSRK